MKPLIHWLAFFIVVAMAVAGLSLVATLYWLFAMQVYENWSDWLKVWCAVVFICIMIWAQAYLSNHGLPWRAKK